ncbi:HSP20-like chaperone [Rhizoclosmatium globosum]|uniref:HSP20-like chaperone n=1 Tax=Rhizoclosmatium globosum TaxID=329046 RepID=A0A1Y2CS42_9FUNG|nr:hypothetical protein HDU79_008161 [Rhizoclosmatium sp. JEL0117]ORY49822.1 HSP20-like chaperone [Rhizoclosmatium globosum]|eukprot:ORY49822.1 HSP20-like chaperone [Rhizoclosmatium globosum]
MFPTNYFNRQLAPSNSDFFRMMDAFESQSPFLGAVQSRNQQPNTVKTFEPTFDVTETPKEFVVLCDAPGFDKGSISVNLDKQLLTVTGERTDTVTDNNAERHIVERRFGSFTRAIKLPSSVDENDVHAMMESGVLHIRIGKTGVGMSKGKRVMIE